jgi:hypothetical protein
MRVMMLMYPGPNAETETNPADANKDLLDAMMAFNQRLVDAGLMLGGDGLMPTRRGARVRFGQGTTTVTDGPFTETKEILGGYWMLNVSSLQEAIDWARQVPCPAGEMIEIRQVWEPEDFGPEVAAQEREMLRQMTHHKPKG